MSLFETLAAAFKGGAAAPARAPLGRSFVSPWASADWRGGEDRRSFNYTSAVRDAYLRNPVAQRAVRRWLDSVRACLRQESGAVVPVMNHHQCPCGRWLRGGGLSRYGHLPAYHDVDVQHEELHVRAQVALEAGESAPVTASDAEAELAAVEARLEDAFARLIASVTTVA